MICKLTPAWKDYLWGGTRLKTEYGKAFDTNVLAETWELSCHPDGESIIATGTHQGESLPCYLASHPEAAGTNCDSHGAFPLMIKLIDAEQNLSIQVHPSDAYAKVNEGQNGKTEVWYVVDAKPDAFLYYGFTHDVSKEEFAQRIENNTLTEVLNKVSAKKGDVFFIEAGTVHAIGDGLLVAEIQQSSNVTYRVYDYGRVGADGKLRDLHIEKAKAVSVLAPARTDYDFNGHMACCESFCTDHVMVQGTHALMVDETSFCSVLVLSGEGTLTCGDETLSFQKGDSLFLSAKSGNATLQGDADVIITTAGKKIPYRIGIDLGGTNIKAGVVDANGSILSKANLETGNERPWQEVVADMVKAVHMALERAHITLEQCGSVGVGCPGTIDSANGTVVYSNNLHWHNVPLRDTLADAFGLPVRVSNDANCAALGELVAGVAKGKQNAVMVTLGTGVGGGVVVDGKVFEGGAGGIEIGHTVLVVDGERCTCGRKGCFEAYASATAIVREGNRMAQQYPDSLMHAMLAENDGKMNGKIPFDAAKQGDVAGRIVVDNYIKYLGAGITDMVNIFRPEVVILSGGVCNEGAYLTVPLSDYVQEHSFAHTYVQAPPIVRAQLGNDAGLIGAASL